LIFCEMKNRKFFEKKSGKKKKWRKMEEKCNLFK
jgi:ribosomal protein S21